MISYVLPTRNRPERLRDTLRALDALGPHQECGGAEVIVVDNDSDERPILPRQLRSGLPLHYIRLKENLGAAARNVGVSASDPASSWIVMLDDDSYPDDTAFFGLLADLPADVGAVSADIFLPGKNALGHAPREMGGLPEVFIGCGVAIRRDLFLSLGGYDHAFNYYVEEYDLAARMMMAGARVVFAHEFTVQHEKDTANRDFNLILSRLVRNNGWIAQRYAPDNRREIELREILTRYREIGEKEDALAGYGQGLRQLRASIRAQRRSPMPAEIWDRFTGLAATRDHLAAAHARAPFRSATIVDAGKNAWAVAKALRELGVRLVDYGEDVDAHVIGTLSPGPMLDALTRRTRLLRTHSTRLLAPWLPASLTKAAKAVEAA
ncbi:MAG: glycosyltransferase family 2 protein [Phycisphaerales bacterium]